MATPETFRALMAANAVNPRFDLKHKTKCLCDNFNEFLYKMAHEPSLAGHRIQEHCHKTVPTLMATKSSSMANAKRIEGAMFDLNYTAEFLGKLDESGRNSIETREIISELASKISAATARANAPNN